MIPSPSERVRVRLRCFRKSVSKKTTQYNKTPVIKRNFHIQRICFLFFGEPARTAGSDGG